MSDGMSITITGVDKWISRLERASVTLPAKIGEAMYAEAELIMTAAKKLTPVGGGAYSPRDPHPGTLRASGHVVPPVITGADVLITLGFGGAASAYARAQHYREDYRHAVGQALYLETPFVAAAAGIGDRIAARVGMDVV